MKRARDDDVEVKEEKVDEHTTPLFRAASLLSRNALRIGAAMQPLERTAAAPPPRVHVAVKREPGAEPFIADAPLPPKSILTLPREMRAITHHVHALDRQCRAAMFDVTRQTELFLALSSSCRESADIPKSLQLQLPRGASTSVAEALKFVEANVRHTELLVLRLAAEKRRVVQGLVRLVEERTELSSLAER